MEKQIEMLAFIDKHTEGMDPNQKVVLRIQGSILCYLIDSFKENPLKREDGS